MSPSSAASTRGRPSGASYWAALSQLAKARVTLLVGMTAACGVYIGARHAGKSFVSADAVEAIVGITAVAAGTAAFNQVLERTVDALMRRTSGRPLITGSLSVAQAVSFGFLLTCAGATLVAVSADATTLALTLGTSALYLAAYTPLKRITPWCTSVGAISGAMPPLLGYRAMAGHIDLRAMLLFGLLFLWQFPHFHSIATIYREDYGKAGIRMLAVVDEDGDRIRRSVAGTSMLLVILSATPAVFRIAGSVYLFASLALAVFLLIPVRQFCVWGLPFDNAVRRATARVLLKATVIYLPALLLVLAVGIRR